MSPHPLTIIAGCVSVAAALTLLALWRRDRLRFRPRPVHVLAVALWVGAVAVGVLASSTGGGALLTWLALPLVAWACAELAMRPYARDLVVPLASIGLAVVAGVALLAWASGAQELQPYTLDGAGRLTWPMPHPNNLGWLCAALLPFPVVAGVSALTRRPRTPAAGAAALAAAALGVAALALTLSRTAWLAALAALLVVALAGIARRALLVLIGGLVLAGLPLAAPRFLSADGGGSNVRLDVWRNAWDMFLGHPLTGVGLGRFSEMAIVIPSGLGTRPAPHAHQLVLGMAAETGVLGLLAILAVIAVGASDAWRSVRGSGQPARLVAGATAGALAAVLVVGVLDDPFADPTLRFVTWGLLGVAAALAAASRAAGATPAPATAAPAGTRPAPASSAPGG